MNKRIRDINDALRIAVEQIDSSHMPPTTEFITSGLAVSTGITELDTTLGGIQNSDLLLIAGRPENGKTSLSITLLLHIALQEKKRVAFFSLEDSLELLTLKMISSYAHIPLQSMQQGTLRDEQWNTLHNAVRELHNASIYFFDSAKQTIIAICSDIQHVIGKHDIDIVFIDYLQLIRSTSKRRTIDDELPSILRALKELAFINNIPIVVLAQLPRSVEERINKRPMLSDVRAMCRADDLIDVALLLYRPELYEANVEEKGIVEIEIAKQRNGPTGVVKQKLFASTTNSLERKNYE